MVGQKGRGHLILDDLFIRLGRGVVLDPPSMAPVELFGPATRLTLPGGH